MSESSLHLGRIAARYDSAGPRYTSYPTAVESVRTSKSPTTCGAWERADAWARPPVRLHSFALLRTTLHLLRLPFLRHTHKEVAEPYLQQLLREFDLLAARLPRRRKVAQFQPGRRHAHLLFRRRNSNAWWPALSAT